MSAEDLHKKYASVMESMLKSAVAETTKLFENMVNELKSEISQMRKENEDLKTRCIQIATADVHSRQSLSAQVDADASMRCDTAVQCDFVSDNTKGVEQCPPLESPVLQRAEYPSEQINYSLQEHNYVVSSNTTSNTTFMDVKEEEYCCDSPEQSFLKQENVELAVISGQKHDDAGSKETLFCEAENIGSTTVQTQTKNKIDLQEAQNQPYNLQNSIVISLKDVFRGDVKEETENEGEMMERETGEHLPTSEKPHIILQDSHQTNETPINKSSIVLLEHGDQRYTDGELAHSTKSLVNKEVEEKGPEDCVEETSYKPVSTSRSRRGRPRKKRQQKKKVKSVSSKVLPVQPGLGDPSVEEHGSKALPLPCSKDGVTSKSSEVLQTELHPIQGSSNTFVKSKKNMEVCSLPVSVECKAKGPASKNQKITESKKASVEVKERAPIISEIETSNTSVSKSENVVTLPHKECSTTASLQDAILLVEAMNQSAVENTVPQSQNSAQSQTRGSAIKRTINNVGQMAQKISLQPLKTLTTKALDASTSRGATTFADSIIPKIIIVQKRNQTVACDGVPPVTVLSEKALTQTPTTSQFPTQPLIVQPNRKTRIILVPRTDCGSASHKTTGVCPLKLSSCTMTENQNNNLPKNSAYVDLPLLPPSTSQAPKKTIKVSYKQIFPDVHSLTKAVSACQQLEFSPQLKKVVESQTAPDKPNSLENLESVVQSESLEIPESVVQRETLGLPESLEMSESVINPESSEMSESVINPESSEMSESVINPESSEMSESIIQPESSEVSESIIQPESSEVSESIIQPESSEVSESIIQPESLEMPESDVQSETSNMPDPLEIPESVAQSKSLVVPKSLEKPQQLEKQELVDQPEFSENSKTVVLKEKQDTEEITTLPEALSMKISTTSQEVKLALIDNMTMVENMDTTDSSDSSDQTTSPSKVANISKEACSSSDKSTELQGSVSSILSVPTKQNVSPVVRLTRLPFFVSTKETVLISRLSSNEYMIDRKDKVGQGIEQKNSGISTSTSSQKAHKKGSVKLSVACNRIDSSQKLAMKRKQTSKKRQDGQLQPTSITFKEAVESDLKATDETFPTPLPVSPMTNLREPCTSNTDGGKEKSRQKCSIFSRLQSHLKAHMESKAAAKEPPNDIKTTSKNSKKPRLENDSVCDGKTSSELSCSSKADVAKKSVGEPVHSKKRESENCDKKCNADEGFSTFNSCNQDTLSVKRTTEESTNNSKKAITKYKSNSKVLNAKETKVKRTYRKKIKSPTKRLRDDQGDSTVVKKCIGKLWYPPTLPPNEEPSTEIRKPPREKVQDKIPFEPFNKTPIISPLQPLAVIGKFLLRNQCGVCGRVFSSSAALESHVSLHKLNQPFSCSLCGKSFPDSAALKRHGRVHRNGRIHVCHQCGKGFVYKFGLSKHLEMVHDKIKRYICQTCNKKFFTKRDVEIHIRSHTGETPFHCNLCERKFTSQVKLNVHLRWHNGEKRHWCPYCDKGFLDYNNLKRHRYIHTGERPCSCPYCPKNFTQIGHLRKHVRNVHKKDI